MSDVLPPPPPKMGGGGGCWKVGFVSCAVGCGLAIVLAIVLSIVFAPRLQQFFGQAMETARDVARAQQEMQVVYQAIEKYRTEQGRYPERLAQLVPKYLNDERQLRYSGNPTGPMFGYRRPTASTRPEDVLLEYTLDLAVPGGSRVSIPMRMRADGRFIDPQGQIQQAIPEGAPTGLPGLPQRGEAGGERAAPQPAGGG